MSSAPRDHGEDKDHSSERWLVSYADFMTLMFAFFAVLYATAQKDVDKTKEFQDSVKRYLVKAGAFGESGQKINQGVEGTTPIEPPIQSYNPNKPATERILDEAEAFIEQSLSKEERAKYITDVAADDWGVRIIIPNSALFSSQSEKFREDALPFLGKLSSLLGKFKRKILVEGHVGEKETGAYRSTWDFASARAVNILRYMQKKEGLPPGALAMASLGDTRPLQTGDNKMVNSRVEIVLLNPDYEF